MDDVCHLTTIGILSLLPEVRDVDMASEPVSRAAVLKYYITKLAHVNDDVIFHYLAKPISQMSSVSTGKGDFFEECVAWFFIRSVLKAGKPVSLGTLLAQLCVSDLPSIVDNYTVHTTKALQSYSFDVGVDTVGTCMFCLCMHMYVLLMHA
jgi:hypothetical protein